jgi:hypothetical protein
MNGPAHPGDTSGHPGDLQAALAVAVAATTAVSGSEPAPLNASQLCDGIDPLTVVQAFAIAWSATLEATVGSAGRATVLGRIGLTAAKEA